MKLNIIRTIEDDREVGSEPILNIEAHDIWASGQMEKGDAILVKFKNRDKLFISCPSCGLASFTGNHKIEKINETITVTPSLVMGCCDWHGFLKKGVFTKV